MTLRRRGQSNLGTSPETSTLCKREPFLAVRSIHHIKAEALIDGARCPRIVVLNGVPESQRVQRRRAWEGAVEFIGAVRGRRVLKSSRNPQQFRTTRSRFMYGKRQGGTSTTGDDADLNEPGS